jgi:hypothetical protein
MVGVWELDIVGRRDLCTGQGLRDAMAVEIGWDEIGRERIRWENRRGA